MKRLLSIATLLIAIIFTSCSSESSMTVKTYFGKWEANTVQIDANTIIKYTDLDTFTRNEELEIFTDQIESAKLVKYPKSSITPVVYLGQVNGTDVITFDKAEERRQIIDVKEKEMSVTTTILYKGKSQVARINYVKIGNPRDEEK